MMQGRLAAMATAAVVAAGCGSNSFTPIPTCLELGCSDGRVCEPMVSRPAPGCFDPVFLAGRVYDLGSADPGSNGVGGARVVGQDVDGAPVSPVAVSAADGSYTLGVTVPVLRNDDGSPASGSVTLRADAAGYQTFPTGLRTALPIALTSAAHADGRWTVQSGVTDVGLEAITGAPAGEIVGTLELPVGGGALVVAVCAGTAYTALPGTDGTYEIYNVPDGICEVTAYAQGVNYTPVGGVTVEAGGVNPVTADLAQSPVPTATVHGSVQFVSSTYWELTSVLLVVDSTYDAVRVRGLAPPGLKASDVSKGGSWTITGIPDGHYHVLAAFETDYVVRDPSDIGGAAVLEFQVVDGVPLLMDGTTSAATLQGFKITGAVRLTAPLDDGTGACSTAAAPLALPADPGGLPVGGCSTASATPTFAWQSYSATDVYEVTVVDELGATAWQAQVAKSSGQVEVAYGATASPVSKTLSAATPLAPGATYQVRIEAQTIDSQSGTVTSTLSTSEDLLGVFTYAP